ncbi:MAG: hypothetical protein WBE46_09335 [Dehalococcoidia bacterium]
MFSATWAANDKITGMKELIESLTRKAGDEILDKKLEKMLDSGGDTILTIVFCTISYKTLSLEGRGSG